MKSNVLINRICRLIETGGASGDGALLSEEYAAAVNKVNNRLDAVVTAADSKSIGDAIRILSEDPPLLEEVSALDFFQRSDWENLCDMKGWTIPPRIDRQMTDRAVAIGETKDAIEPLLAMYKKAVRVNNVRLAVKSLRRLADIDRSQDWRPNLRQFERQLQLHIVEEFRLANKDGKEDVCDALATELLDTAWLDGALASGTEEIREYRARRDAERRDTEGMENISILRKCLDEKWDRNLAFHLVQAIDGLVEKGWRIPDDDKRVVDGCRVKCAREFEQEETDRRWREVNEALNAAIQQEDGDAIREALAVPEFNNREPDDGMEERARNLLSRMEKARRRSRLLKMVVTFLFAAVTVSITGWLIDQHILQKRIDNSAKALTGLLEQFKERPGFTIREMRSTLDWLRENEPRVYKTPEIFRFHDDLSRIIADNITRTNHIVKRLQELKGMILRPEGISDASINGMIEKVEKLLLKHEDEDTEFKNQLNGDSNYWNSHAAKRASNFRDKVVPRLKSAAQRLVGELARGNLRKEVGDCKALLEEWNTVHSRYADGQSSEFTVAKNDFDNALAEQNAYSNAIARLMTAADASAVLVARGELIERYGGRREAKLLKPLQVAIDEVTDVLSSRPTVLTPFLDSIRTGISVAEFNNFLEESVRPIEKWPEYCSLYGVCEKNSQNVFAIAKGACKVSKPGYETRWIVSCDGGLLSMDDRRIVQSLKRKAKPEARLLPSSDEMRLLVEKSKAETIDAASFESAILGLIDGHIKKGHEGRYVNESSTIVDKGRPTRGWMSPYRRVQFVAWYMRWLKDELKTMPDDRELRKWFEDLEQLAKDIRIGGKIKIDDSLSWICLWDDQIRKRTVKCLNLLNRMPIGWVEEYKAAAKADKVMSTIGSWRIAYAGKVKFDPFRFDFEKKPNEISVDAPDAAADHPLYVLRKTNDRLLLIRAFEPGTNIRWRTCEEIERNGGCLLGEPLYHVSRGGTFIDVQRELSKMAGQIGVNKASEKLRTAPIFSHGVK